MDIPTTYCEQLGQMAIQYLNIFTNIFFIAGAIFFVVKIKKANGVVQKRDYFLATLLAIVGIGSFAWHSMPNKWTDYADTLPIILFVFISLVLILKKIFSKNLILQLITLFSITAIGLFLEQIPTLNGSSPYVFLLLVFVLVTIFFKNKYKEASKNFCIASLLFFIGILARTFDLFLCNYIPFGTHFLWHILVASMGYSLLLGISALYRK